MRLGMQVVVLSSLLLLLGQPVGITGVAQGTGGPSIEQRVNDIQANLDALRQGLEDARTRAEDSLRNILLNGLTPLTDLLSVAGLVSDDFDSYCGDFQVNLSTQKQMKSQLRTLNENLDLVINELSIADVAFLNAQNDLTAARSQFELALEAVCQFPPVASPDFLPEPGAFTVTSLDGIDFDVQNDSIVVPFEGEEEAFGIRFRINVLDNDADENVNGLDFELLNGDQLTITDVFAEIPGNVEIDIDGQSIIYTMPSLFDLVEEFDSIVGTIFYTVCDMSTFQGIPSPLCDTGEVNVRINEFDNQPPDAVDDEYGSRLGQVGTGLGDSRDFGVSDPDQGVLRNDSDPDGDDIVVIAVGPDPSVSGGASGAASSDLPADFIGKTACCSGSSENGGVVRMFQDGTFVYSPPFDGFAGDDAFYYRIRDTFGRTGTARVTLSVRPINEPPSAVRDVFEIDEEFALLADNEADLDETLASVSLETFMPTAAASPGNPMTLLDNDNDLSGDTLVVVPGDFDPNDPFNPLTHPDDLPIGPFSIFTDRLGIEVQLFSDGNFVYRIDNSLDVSQLSGNDPASPLVDSFRYGVCDQGTFDPALPPGQPACDFAEVEIRINTLPRANLFISSVVSETVKKSVTADDGTVFPDHVACTDGDTSEVKAGCKLYWIVTIENDGGRDAARVLLNMGSLPGGVRLLDCANISCPDLSLREFSVGQLNVGSAVQAMFTVVVTPDFGGGSLTPPVFSAEVDNQALLGEGNRAIFDPNTDNNREDSPPGISVVQEANLVLADQNGLSIPIYMNDPGTVISADGVRKGLGENPVIAGTAGNSDTGQDYTFTVDVVNTGPSIVEDVRLCVQIPLSVGVTNSDASGPCSSSLTSVPVEFSSSQVQDFKLAAGEAKVTRTVSLTVASDFRVSGTLTPGGEKFADVNLFLDAATPDPMPSSCPTTDCIETSTKVIARANLEITDIRLQIENDIDVRNLPIDPDFTWPIGGIVVVEFTAVNNGPSAAENVTFSFAPEASGVTITETFVGGSGDSSAVLVSSILSGDTLSSSSNNGRPFLLDGGTPHDVPISISVTAAGDAADSDNVTVTSNTPSPIEATGYMMANLRMEMVAVEVNTDTILDVADGIFNTWRIYNDGPSPIRTTSNNGGIGSVVMLLQNPGTDNSMPDDESDSAPSGFSCDGVTGAGTPPRFFNGDYYICASDSLFDADSNVSQKVENDDVQGLNDGVGGNRSPFDVRARVLICSGGSAPSSFDDCTDITSAHDYDLSDNLVLLDECNADGPYSNGQDYNCSGDPSPASTNASDDHEGGQPPSFSEDGTPAPDADDAPESDDEGDSTAPSDEDGEAGLSAAASDALVMLNEQFMQWINAGEQMWQVLQLEQSVAALTTEQSTEQTDVAAQAAPVSATQSEAQSIPVEPVVLAQRTLRSAAATEVVLPLIRAASNQDETVLNTSGSSGTMLPVIAVDPAPSGLVCNEGLFAFQEGNFLVDSALGDILSQIDGQALALEEQLSDDPFLNGLLNLVNVTRDQLNDVGRDLGKFSDSYKGVVDIVTRLNNVNFELDDALADLAFFRSQLSFVDADALANDPVLIDDLVNSIDNVVQNIQDAIDALGTASLQLEDEITKPSLNLVKESTQRTPVLIGWGPPSAFSGDTVLDSTSDFKNSNALRPDADALVDWMEPDNDSETIQVRVGVRNTGLGTLDSVEVTLSGLSGLDPGNSPVSAGAMSQMIPQLAPGEVAVVAIDTGIAYRNFDDTIEAVVTINGTEVDRSSKTHNRCDSVYEQVGSPVVQLGPAPRVSAERAFEFVPAPGFSDTHEWRVYSSDDDVSFTAFPQYPGRGELVSRAADRTAGPLFDILCRKPSSYQWTVTRALPLLPDIVSEEDPLFAPQLAGKTFRNRFDEGVYIIRAFTRLEQEFAISGNINVSGVAELGGITNEHVAIPKPSLHVDRISVGPTGQSLNGGWREGQLVPANFTLDQNVTMDISPRVVNFDVLGLSDLPAARALMEAPATSVQVLVDGTAVGSTTVSNIPIVPVKRGMSGMPMTDSDQFSAGTVGWTGLEGEHSIDAVIDPGNQVVELIETDNQTNLNCLSYWNMQRAPGVGDSFIEFGPSEAVLRSQEDGIILSTRRQPSEGFLLAVEGVLEFSAKPDRDLDQVCAIALRNVWNFGDGSPELNLGVVASDIMGNLVTVTLFTRHFYNEGSFAPQLTSLLGEGGGKVVFQARGDALDVTSRPVVVDIRPGGVGVFLTGIPLPSYRNDVEVVMAWNGNTPQSVTYNTNWSSSSGDVVVADDPNAPSVGYEMSELKITQGNTHNILSINAVGLDPETNAPTDDLDTFKMQPKSYEFVAGNPGADLFGGFADSDEVADASEPPGEEALQVVRMKEGYNAILNPATGELMFQSEHAAGGRPVAFDTAISHYSTEVATQINDHIQAAFADVDDSVLDDPDKIQAILDEAMAELEIEISPLTEAHAVQQNLNLSKDQEKVQQKTLAQTAPAEITLTINAIGTGRGAISTTAASMPFSCDVDPAAGSNLCEIMLPEGSAETLQLTPQPAIGSTFTEWTGCDSGIAVCVVNLNADKTVTIEFTETLWTLQVDPQGRVDGSGDGVVTSSVGGLNCDSTNANACSVVLMDAVQVALSAQPNADSEFVGWSGNCTGTDPNVTVTMTEDIICVATFKPAGENTFTLNVSLDGDGGGSVTSGNNEIDCGVTCTYTTTLPEPPAEGEMPAEMMPETITLTAQVPGGAQFAGWSGDCSGPAPTTTVILDANKQCVAAFNLRAFSLGLMTAGDGGGVVRSDPPGIQCDQIAAGQTVGGLNPGETSVCTGSFPSGDVRLIAEPTASSQFVQWENCPANGLECVVELDAGKTVTAEFGLQMLNFSISLGVLQTASASLATTLFNQPKGTAQVAVIPPGGTEANQQLFACNGTTSVLVESNGMSDRVCNYMFAYGSTISMGASIEPGITVISSDPNSAYTFTPNRECESGLVTNVPEGNVACAITLSEDLAVAIAFFKTGSGTNAAEAPNNFDEDTRAGAAVGRLLAKAELDQAEKKLAQAMMDGDPDKIAKAQEARDAAELKLRTLEETIARHQVEDAQKNLDNLNMAGASPEEIAAAERRLMERQNELAAAREARAAIEKVIADRFKAEAEMREMEAQMAKDDADMEVRDAEMTLMQTDADLMMAQTTQTDAQDDFDTKDMRVMDLEQQIEDLKAIDPPPADFDMQLQTLEDQLMTATQERDDAMTSLDMANEEVARLEGEKMDAETALETAQENAVVTNQRLEDTKLEVQEAERVSAQASVNEANSKLEQKRNEINDLQGQIGAKDMEIGAKDMEIMMTQDQIGAKNMEIMDVGDQIMMVQDQIDTLEANTMRTDAEDQQLMDLKEQRDQLNDQRMMLEMERDDLDNTKMMLEMERDTLNTDKDDLEMMRMMASDEATMLAMDRDMARMEVQTATTNEKNTLTMRQMQLDMDIMTLEAKPNRTESEENQLEFLKQQKAVVDEQINRINAIETENMQRQNIDMANDTLNDPNASDADRMNASMDLDMARMALDDASMMRSMAESDIDDMNGNVADPLADPDNDKGLKNVQPSIGLDISIEHLPQSKTYIIAASASVGAGAAGGGNVVDSVKQPKNTKLNSGGDQKSKTPFGINISLTGSFDWNTAASSGSVGGTLDISFNVPISAKPEVSVTFTISNTLGQALAGNFQPDGKFYSLVVSLGLNIEIPIPNPILPLSADIGFVVSYTVDVRFAKDEPRAFSVVEMVEDDLTIELEVWAAIDLEVVKGGPFGGGSASFGFVPDKAFKCVTGTFGLRLEVDIKIFTGTFEKKWSWTEGECSPIRNIQIETPFTLTLNMDRPYAGPDYATFVNQMQAMSQFGVQEFRLVENAFPGSDPQLLFTGEQFLLVWVQDDVDKPLLQGRELWYTTAGLDLNFSAPQRLTSDLVQDADPNLSVDRNGNVVMLWSRNKNPEMLASLDPNRINQELLGQTPKFFTEDASEPLNDNVLPQEGEDEAVVQVNQDPSFLAALAEQEMAYAVFDPATGTWSDPVFLTSNDVLDEDANLVSDEQGNLKAIWARNETNMPYPLAVPPEPSTLYSALWNPDTQTFDKPEVLRETDLATSRSFAYRDGKLFYLWIENDRAFAAFYEGGDLSMIQQLAPGAGTQSSPAAAFTPEGVPLALFIERRPSDNENEKGTLGGKLMEFHFINDEWVMNPLPLDDVNINGFNLVQDADGNLALVWSQLSSTMGRGIDAFSMIYDRDMGGWSNKKQLTDDESLENDMSTVLVGHDVITAYLKEEVTFAEEMFTYSGPDLDDPSIIYENEVFPVPDVPQFGASHLQVLKAGLNADLLTTTDAVQLSPRVPELGDTVTLTVPINNTGRMGVEADQIDVELRETPDGPAIERQTLEALAIDAQGEVTFNYNVPNEAGRHIVYTVIDPDGNLEEITSDNNITPVPVITHDWEISDFNFEYRLGGMSMGDFMGMMEEGRASDEMDDMLNSPYQEVHLSLTVRNQGVVAAPEGVIDLFFTRDSNFVPGPRNDIGQIAVPELGPGESVNLSFVWDVTNLEDAAYRLRGELSAVSSVDALTALEVDRDNNEFLLFVRRQPDLSVRGVQGVDESGDETLNITVFNSGAAAAENVTISVFERTDDGALGELLMFFSVLDIPELLEIAAFEGQVSISALKPATSAAEIVVVVDPDAQIIEIDESNNTDVVMIEN